MLDPASGSKNQFAAYDIKAFTDLDRFKDTMDEMLRTLRTAAPAPGQERVLYPGLSEAEEVEHRRAHGIPLHREVIEWFGECTAEMGLPPLRRDALSRRAGRSSAMAYSKPMADERGPAAIPLLYGRGTLPVTPPRGCVPTVIEKRAMPVLADPPARCAAPWPEPVGVPPLAELARGKRSACILICDITRPVPNGLFLAPLIRTLLDAGVPPAGITVLVATGLHRPNEGAELAELVGDPWVLDAVAVVNHDATVDARPRAAGAHAGPRHAVASTAGSWRPTQDRHRPGRAALHGRLVGRPQGDRARRGPRRDDHHLPQLAPSWRPARGQLRAGRQPAARGAARDRARCWAARSRSTP